MEDINRTLRVDRAYVLRVYKYHIDPSLSPYKQIVGDRFELEVLPYVSIPLYRELIDYMMFDMEPDKQAILGKSALLVHTGPFFAKEHDLLVRSYLQKKPNVVVAATTRVLFQQKYNHEIQYLKTLYQVDERLQRLIPTLDIYWIIDIEVLKMATKLFEHSQFVPDSQLKQLGEATSAHAVLLLRDLFTRYILPNIVEIDTNTNFMVYYMRLSKTHPYRRYISESRYKSIIYEADVDLIQLQNVFFENVRYMDTEDEAWRLLAAIDTSSYYMCLGHFITKYVPTSEIQKHSVVNFEHHLQEQLKQKEFQQNKERRDLLIKLADQIRHIYTTMSHSKFKDMAFKVLRWIVGGIFKVIGVLIGVIASMIIGAVIGFVGALFYIAGTVFTVLVSLLNSFGQGAMAMTGVYAMIDRILVPMLRRMQAEQDVLEAGLSDVEWLRAQMEIHNQTNENVLREAFRRRVAGNEESYAQRAASQEGFQNIDNDFQYHYERIMRNPDYVGRIEANRVHEYQRYELEDRIEDLRYNPAHELTDEELAELADLQMALDGPTTRALLAELDAEAAEDNLLDDILSADLDNEYLLNELLLEQLHRDSVANFNELEEAKFEIEEGEEEIAEGLLVSQLDERALFINEHLGAFEIQQYQAIQNWRARRAQLESERDNILEEIEELQGEDGFEYFFNGQQEQYEELVRQRTSINNELYNLPSEHDLASQENRLLAEAEEEARGFEPGELRPIAEPEFIQGAEAVVEAESMAVRVLRVAGEAFLVIGVLAATGLWIWQAVSEHNHEKEATTQITKLNQDYEKEYMKLCDLLNIKPARRVVFKWKNGLIREYSYTISYREQLGPYVINYMRYMLENKHLTGDIEKCVDEIGELYRKYLLPGYHPLPFDKDNHTLFLEDYNRHNKKHLIEIYGSTMRVLQAENEVAKWRASYYGAVHQKFVTDTIEKHTHVIQLLPTSPPNLSDSIAARIVAQLVQPYTKYEPLPAYYYTEENKYKSLDLVATTIEQFKGVRLPPMDLQLYETIGTAPAAFKHIFLNEFDVVQIPMVLNVLYGSYHGHSLYVINSEFFVCALGDMCALGKLYDCNRYTLVQLGGVHDTQILFEPKQALPMTALTKLSHDPIVKSVTVDLYHDTHNVFVVHDKKASVYNIKTKQLDYYLIATQSGIYKKSLIMQHTQPTILPVVPQRTRPAPIRIAPPRLTPIDVMYRNALEGSTNEANIKSELDGVRVIRTIDESNILKPEHKANLTRLLNNMTMCPLNIQDNIFTEEVVMESTFTNAQYDEVAPSSITIPGFGAEAELVTSFTSPFMKKNGYKGNVGVVAGNDDSTCFLCFFDVERRHMLSVQLPITFALQTQIMSVHLSDTAMMIGVLVFSMIGLVAEYTHSDGDKYVSDMLQPGGDGKTLINYDYAYTLYSSFFTKQLLDQAETIGAVTFMAMSLPSGTVVPATGLYLVSKHGEVLAKTTGPGLHGSVLGVGATAFVINAQKLAAFLYGYLYKGTGKVIATSLVGLGMVVVGTEVLYTHDTSGKLGKVVRKLSTTAVDVSEDIKQSAANVAIGILMFTGAWFIYQHAPAPRKKRKRS